MASDASFAVDLIDLVRLLGVIIEWHPIKYFLFLYVVALKTPSFCQYILPSSCYAQLFILLFLFRYIRLMISIVAVSRYKPIEVPSTPLYTPDDVTVIIPTVEPFGEDFERTVLSAITAGCAEILIVTVGSANMQRAAAFISQLDFRISVLSTSRANKRQQVCRGLLAVRTPLVVLADDHVFWPSGFLSALLAPFSADPLVGGVACSKRVLRSYGRLFSSDDIRNFLACLYLERHNFDLAASSTLDGGLFVISGRTAAYRSDILRSAAFRSAFVTEMWMGCGPLNADDDNFITRWLLTHGYKTAFQAGIVCGAAGSATYSSCMETTLGTTGGWRKFNAQLVRWARTTWRSNSTALFAERVVWRTQAWSVYAVYLSSFVNFALLTDGLLILLLLLLLPPANQRIVWLACLIIWMLFTKLVKSWPHYRRCPRDWLYFPLAVAFGYYHSLVKLHALLTVGEVGWGSRPGLVQ